MTIIVPSRLEQTDDCSQYEYEMMIIVDSPKAYKFSIILSQHSQKKGYRNSTPEVLLLQIAPFFQRGAFFP